MLVPAGPESPWRTIWRAYSTTYQCIGPSFACCSLGRPKQSIYITLRSMYWHETRPSHKIVSLSAYMRLYIHLITVEGNHYRAQGRNEDFAAANFHIPTTTTPRGSSRNRTGTSHLQTYTTHRSSSSFSSFRPIDDASKARLFLD